MRPQKEKDAFNDAFWATLSEEDTGKVLDMFRGDSGYAEEVSNFAVSLTEVKTRFTGTDPSEMLGHIFGDIDTEEIQERSFAGHRGFSGDMD